MSGGPATGSKRPPNTPFKQQNLKAWRPILTPPWVIGIFLAIGIIFIPIGIAVYMESEQVVEAVSKPYDAKVSDGGCCVKNCGSDNTNPPGTAGARVDLNPCQVEIEIKKDMKGPVYMYYMLDNFYQNHRRYVKSRQDSQLRGTKIYTDASKLSDCDPLKELPKGYPTSVPGSDSKVINPCGLIAWSMFNDTFSLTKKKIPTVEITTDGDVYSMIKEKDYNFRLATGTQNSLIAPTDCPGEKCIASSDFIKLKKEGIAWPSDKDKKFKNSDWSLTEEGATGWNFPPFAETRIKSGCKSGVTPTVENTPPGHEQAKGTCTEDEDFMVWMRTAGLPKFRKLYRIVDGDLKKDDFPDGKAYVQIYNGALPPCGASPTDTCHELPITPTNTYFNTSQHFLYPVHTFDGHKYVVLSTSSVVGGRNPFLGIAYIVVGAVCIFLAIIFFLKSRISPRKLGDTNYIEWGKEGSPVR